MINPPNTKARGYEGEHSPPPLGLAYIASYLERDGIDAGLFDLAHMADVNEALLAARGFFDYEIYGFTSYTKTFGGALDVLRVLRRNKPDAVVVFGGPHASTSAEAVLADHPEIDFIILNDGEVPMLELVRALERGGAELGQLPNLIYREGWSRSDRSYGGAVRQSTVTAEVPPLDALPFPKRSYEIEPSRDDRETRRHTEPADIAYACSSRGCPKRCSFCSIIVMSPKYRFRSVESLMEEIRLLFADRPFGHIAFLDANFFVHVERTRAFARALHDFDSRITWSGTATADRVVHHADILREIGALNCAYLEVGIESGSRRALSRFNKWTTVEQNLCAINLLNRAGIEISLDFIMFDPETTLEDLWDNLAFLYRAELMGYAPADCLYNPLKLYAGTPARTRYTEMFGLREHHMMELVPPFLDASVAAVFRTMNWYLAHRQRAIDEAIARCDALRMGTAKDGVNDASFASSRAQQYAALGIRLRHLPYHFFEQVLIAAVEKALPDRPSAEALYRCGLLDSTDLLLNEAVALSGGQSSARVQTGERTFV
ncbi:MAG TPA: radical SAM protein [Pyrinomonadaceae bacterium]